MMKRKSSQVDYKQQRVPNGPCYFPALFALNSTIAFTTS